MTELGAVETGTPSPANWVPEDSFADRLARLRRKMGWNFMEAGRATGLSGKSWRLWEQHDRQPYNLLEVATKISETTGVSLVWLLTGDGTGKPTVPYLGPYLPEYVNLEYLAASGGPVATTLLAPAA